MLKSGKIQSIRTEAADVWMDQNQILHVKVLPQSRIDLQAAQAAHQAHLSLCGPVVVPILVDIRNIKSVSKEARDFVKLDGPKKVTKALALLVGSKVSKVIASFATGINRPDFPIKTFTSKEEALIWLRSQRDN